MTTLGTVPNGHYKKEPGIEDFVKLGKRLNGYSAFLKIITIGDGVALTDGHFLLFSKVRYSIEELIESLDYCSVDSANSVESLLYTAGFHNHPYDVDRGDYDPKFHRYMSNDSLKKTYRKYGTSVEDWKSNKHPFVGYAALYEYKGYDLLILSRRKLQP